MRRLVGVVLDAVGQLEPLVPALVAEELPVDCHVTEVTVVLVTAVLTVVPVRGRITTWIRGLTVQ